MFHIYLTNGLCYCEFDGMLLKNINEEMYENEVLHLPCNQDVGDYLQFKVFFAMFIWCDPCLIFRNFTSIAIIF